MTHLCPVCQIPLAETAIQTPAGPHCTGCGHVWRIDGEHVLALNSPGRHVPESLVHNPAPCVTLDSPSPEPSDAGPMTAAKAACFVEEEVG